MDPTAPSVQESSPAGANTPAQLDAVVIAGAIVAVTVVLTCLAVVLLRYMYRHKGSYCTNEAKGTEYAETADAALRNDPTLQDGVADSKREYFI